MGWPWDARCCTVHARRRVCEWLADRCLIDWVGCVCIVYGAMCVVYSIHATVCVQVGNRCENTSRFTVRVLAAGGLIGLLICIWSDVSVVRIFGSLWEKIVSGDFLRRGLWTVHDREVKAQRCVVLLSTGLERSLADWLAACIAEWILNSIYIVVEWDSSSLYNKSRCVGIKIVGWNAIAKLNSCLSLDK